MKQSLIGAIATKKDILSQIPTLTESNILDSETAELRTYKLRTEIAAIEARLAQLPPVDLQATAQAVSIPQFWLDLSEPERRFYFREFISQIQIMRTDRYRIVRYADGEPLIELYDHQTDPYEKKNIASERPDIVEQLLPQLEADTPTLL